MELDEVENSNEYNFHVISTRNKEKSVAPSSNSNRFLTMFEMTVTTIINYQEKNIDTKNKNT